MKHRANFDALLSQAIYRCEGQLGLARRLGYNKNNIRQWIIGLSLPSQEAESKLARAAGVTRSIMRRAIRDEMIRRWDWMRNQPIIRNGIGRPQGRIRVKR